MTTDTDATALRLLNKVLAPLVTVDCYNLSSPHDYALWRNEIDAALDTLTQYHRQAGAVESCKEAVDRFCPPGSALRETCGQQTVIAGKPAQRVVCGSHLMLEAAQAQLAAYEEER